jgi:hypothetical protein
MLPASYDAWQLAGPGERATDAPYAGPCPNCNCDCYGMPSRATTCAGCRCSMCEDCRRSHRCECGKLFCETCLTAIDGLWLCLACCAIHRLELVELERLRTCLNVRAARTVPEKQAIALAWAVDRALANCRRERAAQRKETNPWKK